MVKLSPLMMTARQHHGQINIHSRKTDFVHASNMTQTFHDTTPLFCNIIHIASCDHSPGSNEQQQQQKHHTDILHETTDGILHDYWRMMLINHHSTVSATMPDADQSPQHSQRYNARC